MMRKRIGYFIGACLGLSLCFIGVGCEEEPHVHNYNTDWEKDVSSHWLRCFDCEEATDSSLHVGGKATCTQRAVCSVCGEPYGDFALHAYTIEKSNENYHWKACSCGAVNENSKESHTGGKATCTERATCEICYVEYGILSQHEYVIGNCDSMNHWQECTCGEKDENSIEKHYGGEATCKEQAVCVDCQKPYGGYADHRGGEATCKAQAVCVDCQNPYGDTLDHKYTENNHDANEHWQECTCGEKDENSIEKHYGGEATCKEQAVCADCNTPYGGYADHRGGEATCKAQAVCVDCQNPYGDTLDHKYTENNHDANEHWQECACGEVNKESIEKHYGGEATCKAQAVCADCNTPYGGYADHRGGEATCKEQAVCVDCQKPYGEYAEHEYNVDNQNDTHTWKECVCGEVDESTIKEIPVEDDALDEDERVYVELDGYGTEDEPYVLTESCCVQLEISGYNEVIYFIYEPFADGAVSFTDTDNVDETAFQYGEEVYDLTYVDPAYIEVKEGTTYYFVMYANDVGKLSFTFTVEE